MGQITSSGHKLQGYGCMGLSAFYPSAKTTTAEKAKAVVHHAIKNGVVLLNTATFYGPLNEMGYGSNLRLLKTCLEGIDRSRVHLMVKIGMDTRCPEEKTGTSWVMHGDAAYLQADVDYALEQLGTDYIDTIVLCRVPPPPTAEGAAAAGGATIEEAVTAMQAIVDSGKAHHIGLSEASATTIRRAHAVAPIACIEQEWSLWARDIEQDIVPTCRELGIKIVAYSPLGRGFLAGAAQQDSLDSQDFRKHLPKFSGANGETNQALVEAARTIAERKGIAIGQLALAWLHAQGSDVIPIPGTSSVNHFDENYAALNVELSAEELAEIDRIFAPDASPGERYPGNHNTFHQN